eukprot:TRINITY_DN2949_c0_g1_i3.p1 TRINITY_DN2949_c0_g1~~TRINITY_DN2949_c0_g1_i3.p1  ORF type:complete len:423 (+),score=-53.04 TRINITY_DN2949_c0_g1_i3:114-1271(+)
MFITNNYYYYYFLILILSTPPPQRVLNFVLHPQYSFYCKNIFILPQMPIFFLCFLFSYFLPFHLCSRFTEKQILKIKKKGFNIIHHFLVLNLTPVVQKKYIFNQHPNIIQHYQPAQHCIQTQLILFKLLQSTYIVKFWQKKQNIIKLRATELDSIEKAVVKIRSQNPKIKKRNSIPINEKSNLSHLRLSQEFQYTYFIQTQYNILQYYIIYIFCIIMILRTNKPKINRVIQDSDNALQSIIYYYQSQFSNFTQLLWIICYNIIYYCYIPTFNQFLSYIIIQYLIFKTIQFTNLKIVCYTKDRYSIPIFNQLLASNNWTVFNRNFQTLRNQYKLYTMYCYRQLLCTYILLALSSNKYYIIKYIQFFIEYHLKQYHLIYKVYILTNK